MTNILLFVLIGLVALLVALLLYVLIRVYIEYAKINEVVKTFITPPEEGKPSALAMTSQAFAEIIARSMMAQAKGFLMGLQSGETRGKQAIAGDVVQDSLGASPLAAILGSFPSLKKSLRRNPQLLDLAMGMLTKGNSGGGGSSNNGHSDFQSRLGL